MLISADFPSQAAHYKKRPPMRAEGVICFYMRTRFLRAAISEHEGGGRGSWTWQRDQNSSRAVRPHEYRLLCELQHRQ